MTSSELTQAIFAAAILIVTWLGKRHAKEAAKEASQVNDAVNHIHPEQPRLFDLMLETNDLAKDAKERSIISEERSIAADERSKAADKRSIKNTKLIESLVSDPKAPSKFCKFKKDLKEEN